MVSLTVMTLLHLLLDSVDTESAVTDHCCPFSSRKWIGNRFFWTSLHRLTRIQLGMRNLSTASSSKFSSGDYAIRHYWSLIANETQPRMKHKHWKIHRCFQPEKHLIFNSTPQAKSPPGKHSMASMCLSDSMLLTVQERIRCVQPPDIRWISKFQVYPT